MPAPSRSGDCCPWHRTGGPLASECGSDVRLQPPAALPLELPDWTKQLPEFVRRGESAQGLVDELLTVRALGNTQLAQRLSIAIGEFLSRYNAETSPPPLYARLVELAAAGDAFTRELAAAARQRKEPA